MTLGLYLARRFLFSFLCVFGIFFVLLLLIDFVEQLRFLGNKQISTAQIFGLVLLNVPTNLQKILPLVMLFASIFALLSMSRSSELVIARAAGQSGIKLLIAPMLTAFSIGLVSLMIFNPIVAISMQQYDASLSRYVRGTDSIFSVSSEGLWLRQGGPDGQSVIKATRANSDGTVLYGASFWTFDGSGTPISRIEANIAQLEPGAWILSNARKWDLRVTNPQAEMQALTKGEKINSDLTPDAIRDSFGKPAAISIWILPSYIEALEFAGFSAKSHRLWLQMELALPFFLATMVLLAAGFTMRPSRLSASGGLIVFAVLSGFAIYFIRNLAQILGGNGQIPIMLAAWGPPGVVALCAIGLLLHLEES
ncbi:MAG: LPS export ABC transporter permease LptG [Paracoccaceae bacterium]|jgi:lipopolysaccharide export system permease protein